MNFPTDKCAAIFKHCICLQFHCLSMIVMTVQPYVTDLCFLQGLLVQVVVTGLKFIVTV